MLRYKEIKQMLLHEIAQREQMERLPSRTVLCKRFDTTRTTLDKAIKELEAEGFLVCRDGSGTYVAAPPGFDPQKPQNWGVLVPNSTEDIFANLVRGVEDITQQEGINLILCNCDQDVRKQEMYVRRLMLTGVSGLIIVPVSREDTVESQLLYDGLSECRIPFVFCHNGVSGIEAPVVTSNNFYGGYLATKHLLAQGYRRIAYLGETEYRTSLERYQGYTAALQEAGITLDRELICFCRGSHRPVTELLNGRPDVDALFCFNDTVVGRAYRAIQESGKRVSDDIGVIGYDNTGICEILNPTVTSLSYRHAEIGQRAAQLLLNRIRGEELSEFSYYVYQPTVVERNSCRGRRNAP